MKATIKILLLLLPVGISPLCAQHFLQQGNQWIFEYNVYDVLTDPLVSQTIETITVDSDTLINNLTYSKLVVSHAAPCGIFYETEYLREEGSKIFRLTQDHTQEFLMIDFGETTGYEILYEAGVGDIDTGTVLVDSFGIEILNDGSQHEVQYVRILNNNSFDDDAQYKVYKDIGFVQYGLLFPNLGTGLCDVMEGIQLRCYISAQDTIHFKEMDCYASDIIDATNEVDREEIILFPNPTKESIYIYNRQDLHTAHFWLLDMNGHVVYRVDDPAGSSFPLVIDLKSLNLTAGVYVLNMVIHNRFIQKKIVFIQ